MDPRSYSLYFDLNIWFRARKVTGTFKKRAPEARVNLLEFVFCERHCPEPAKTALSLSPLLAPRLLAKRLKRSRVRRRLFSQASAFQLIIISCCILGFDSVLLFYFRKPSYFASVLEEILELLLCCGDVIGIIIIPIHHFHIDHNELCLPPELFYITIVSNSPGYYSCPKRNRRP